MAPAFATRRTQDQSPTAYSSRSWVLSAAANGIGEFIEDNGGCATSVLDTVGIAEDDTHVSDTKIELNRYCSLLELAAKETCNDNFGLHYGKNFSPMRLGLIGQIAIAAPNISFALDYLARYFPYHQQNTQTAFRREQDLWHLEYRIQDGYITQRRQDAELTMGMYLNIIRYILGKNWVPDEVHFEHPRPEFWREHEAVFCAPVYFNMKTNALVFKHRQVVAAKPDWEHNRLRELCDTLSALAQTKGDLSLSQLVTGEIRAQLPEGYPHIENVAEALSMTRWTLQRRLANEGQVFSSLVEETRRKLALSYLKEAHLLVNDIAGILGYSELSAFSRACVRWFGFAPSRIRSSLISGSQVAANH